ncbi:protein FAR1-RELATED SEQUENCE 5-like [Pyrus ussuriensis x Pyrus communis]|uniref:Protein FAR1-RELATED SEQUENCE 5-like n=1 Tax=Pyrus ussuriensis x Pyrus communis TaxID=2448454 RepID=A0A5N5FK96_9ROSA|nr:protein FAR1-RELATED SEQUENCE 5-like [Pyrus ussuriensis x Pyrus communis]
MILDNADQVATYYKKYGRQSRFPMTKRSSAKGDDGKLRYITMCCTRSGTSKSTSINHLKPYPNLYLDEKWRVNYVKLDHNHGLSPTKTRYWKCFWEVSSSVKKNLEVNDKAGIRVNKSYNLVVVEVGGHDNMKCLEKDCRNYIEKVRRLRLGEGDITAIQNYFVNMQAQNANFFYAIDSYKNGRLRNVFGQMQGYDMPFAPFVGIPTPLFGCLIPCLHDHAPSRIITYQDKGMKKAIKVVFPNTRHRLCLWHIMKKVPNKLKSYKEYESMSSSLDSIVYDSMTSEDFEEH